MGTIDMRDDINFIKDLLKKGTEQKDVNIRVKTEGVDEGKKKVDGLNQSVEGLKKALSDDFILNSKGFEKEISNIERRVQKFYNNAKQKDKLGGFDFDTSNKGKGAIKQYLKDLAVMEELGMDVKKEFYDLQEEILNIDNGGELLGKNFSAGVDSARKDIESLKESVRGLYESLAPSRSNYNLSEALLGDTHKVTAPMSELKANFHLFQQMLDSGDIKGSQKDWSEAGLRAGYAYYKSIEEALRQGKSEDSIRKYILPDMQSLLEFWDEENRSVSIERQGVEDLLRVYSELNNLAKGTDTSFIGGFQNLSIKDQISQIVEQTGLLQARMESGDWGAESIDALKDHILNLRTTLLRTIDEAPKLQDVFDYEINRFNSMIEPMGGIDSDLYFEFLSKIREEALTADEAFEQLKARMDAVNTTTPNNSEADSLNRQAEAAGEAADQQERLNDEREKANRTTNENNTANGSAQAQKEQAESAKKAADEQEKSNKLSKEHKAIIDEELSAYKDLLEVREAIAKAQAKGGENDSELDVLKSRKEYLQSVYQERKKEAEAVDVIANNEERLNNITKARKDTAYEINRIQAKAKDDVVAQITGLSNKLGGMIKSNKGTDKWTPEYMNKLAGYSADLDDLQKRANSMSLEPLKQEFESLHNKIEDAIGEKSFDKYRKASEVQLAKLEKQISQITEKNTKMGSKFRSEWENLKIKLDSAQTVGEVKKISAEINRLQARMADAGKTGQRFIDLLKSRFESLNATFITRYLSLYRVVGYVKEMITTIKDLDYALVDLKKTTSMTSQQLDQFYLGASDVAKSMGTTTEEIINQAAAWSRLNKIGLLYSNV